MKLQPEPEGFDAQVRKRGHMWLQAQAIDLTQAPPSASALPSYWQEFNYQLWTAYSGVCAYLAIFFEWPIGAANTDHFVAKSKAAGQAYEWSNYRLACLGANRKKGVKEDLLDPVGLASHTFVINFASGQMSPNPTLKPQAQAVAGRTIEQLGLDSPAHQEMRARHYQTYESGDCTLSYLQRHSPFVHSEILRQGLNAHS